MYLHRCLYSHSVVVWCFRIYATDQFSGVFFRNHLGSKKNTSVIFVITFCNYPHATLLERRKTAVSLQPRSPSKHVLPFGGAACFKGGVTLLHLCQHSDETEKHSVDGKALIFKTWRPGQHIFCFCAIVKLAERVKRLFFLWISVREIFELCFDVWKWSWLLLTEVKHALRSAMIRCQLLDT